MNNSLETAKYETRVTRLTVNVRNETIFAETATEVEIVDEAAGEFVEVSQEGRESGSKITIDPLEWPTLREAIDRMIAECRG